MTPPSGPFAVYGVGLFRQQIEGLLRIADQRGLRALLLGALREMRERLQSNPREWGDPYKNYPSLNAVRYGRTILPAQLRVSYSVHDTERIVWISSLRALHDSPFA
jgi:hypothetical protein